MAQLNPTTPVALLDRAYSVKRRFLEMYKAANAGHVGSALSCAEMLVFLKFGWMAVHDVVVLSKGHAAAALYSVLAEDGALTEAEIASFYKDGTYLPAHPPVNRIATIPFATGSLGHGLSLAAGMALASRLKHEDRTFFCITSDGELNEGSVWEAALFAAHHRLSNLVWLIDRNHLQGFGRTEQVMRLEPLPAKLRAFGLDVVSADGHDFESLLRAKDSCAGDEATFDLPKVVVCTTRKGNGLLSLENTVDCHYLPLNDEQYRHVLVELESVHEASRSRYLA